MHKLSPEIDNWYSANEGQILFEVVAIDEQEQTIEVQHIDGELEEFDLDSWRQMELEPAEPPEDWRVAYEVSEEDYPDPGAVITPEISSDDLVTLVAIESDYIAQEDEPFVINE